MASSCFVHINDPPSAAKTVIDDLKTFDPTAHPDLSTQSMYKCGPSSLDLLDARSELHRKEGNVLATLAQEFHSLGNTMGVLAVDHFEAIDQWKKLAWQYGDSLRRVTNGEERDHVLRGCDSCTLEQEIEMEIKAMAHRVEIIKWVKFTMKRLIPIAKIDRPPAIPQPTQVLEEIKEMVAERLARSQIYEYAQFKRYEDVTNSETDENSSSSIEKAVEGLECTENNQDYEQSSIHDSESMLSDILSPEPSDSDILTPLTNFEDSTGSDSDYKPGQQDVRQYFLPSKQRQTHTKKRRTRTTTQSHTTMKRSYHDPYRDASRKRERSLLDYSWMRNSSNCAGRCNSRVNREVVLAAAERFADIRNRVDAQQVAEEICRGPKRLTGVE